MAMNEDVRAAAGWILDRMERDQDERRTWQDAAMAQNAASIGQHQERTTRMYWLLALRPMIELAILITLIIKL